jgi:replication-associated recombination protein RarA
MLSKKKRSDYMLPLAEKYRPKDFDSFVGHTNVVRSIKTMIKNKSLVNMIFCGTPGTGKNTLSRIIASELESWMTEFDAAKGNPDINIVEDMARTCPIDGSDKIIFIDNCEEIDEKFQRRLSVVMEKCPYTKFILACNDKKKLINPLQSRCLIMEFIPFTPEQIYQRLKHIVEREGIKVEEKLLKTIANTSNSDMRKAINALESVSILHNIPQT